MAAVHLDFETRSAVDLKKAGVYRYAEDTSTAVWVARFRFDDGPVEEWRPLVAEPPATLVGHVAGGGRVVAHNAAFERTIWNRCLPQYCVHPLPKLQPEQMNCTMARAQALGLPASLEALGAVLKLPIQKDLEGRRLMMKMSRPRKINDDGSRVWWDEPANIDRLSAYCATDVLTECGADAALPQLSEAEQRLWVLDQKINDRGVAIDVRLVQRALDVVAEAKKRADRQMWRLTGGAVAKCTEVAKIVDWLNARGIACESVAKGEVEDLIVHAQLVDDEKAEEVIRLRRAAGKASTAKYQAMLNSVCADGRVRGTLAYHAAHTGRWGGRLIQPQNFPRVDPDRDLPDVQEALEVLDRDGLTPQRRCDLIELITGSVMETLSKALRAMLIAGGAQ